MSISSNDINMLLKPTTKTTLLGGSRLMSNFKSTGYKINGGEEEKKKEEQKDTDQKTAEETKSAGEQKETQKNAEQTTEQTTDANKLSMVKKIFNNVLFKGGIQQTQEHQEGGGIIKDSLIIAAKIILVFFMVIFIIILIEVIIKIIKKYVPNLKQYSSGKCGRKKSKKGKKIRKQRKLIIAPVPCSEYVNSLNNQIKTQQQMQQGVPQIQQTQQGTPQQMQQQTQEQMQQEQNLLQEASMINPLNSALRDDDLFKDRLELQGVRNMQVNTSDFL